MLPNREASRIKKHEEVDKTGKAWAHKVRVDAEAD
jgi:hypothetical protein